MNIYNPLKNKSGTQIASFILFALSVIILSLTIFFSMNSLDVMTNWRLSLPDQKIHVGDRVIVSSSYTKIREAKGESVRYLECKNMDGINLRYELNRRNADKQPGSGDVGVDVTMRDDIPDLPARCKIAVAIAYETFIPWYKYPESTTTDEFTLYPKDSTLEDESQETSQIQLAENNQIDLESSSYTNSTPQPSLQQRDISQDGPNVGSEPVGETLTPPIVQEPFLVRIVRPILNLIGV